MRIFYFLMFFIFLMCKSQYTASYSVTRKVSDRKFYADGFLLIDTKERKSNFYLSQYKNLLKKNYKLDENGDTIRIVQNDNICFDNKEYFFDFANKKRKLLLYDVSCDFKVLISERIKYPKWIIEKTLTKYKDWDVYKAFATINGRKWTVFFTKKYKTDSFGPWLFVGLPGLVVYASEEMNEYFFELNKIEEDRSMVVNEPSSPKKVSFRKYVKNAIINNKSRMIKKIAKEMDIPENEVDLSFSPKYETLDFKEK